MDFANSCYTFLYNFNQYLSIPTIAIFFGIGLILTFKTKIPQIFAFKKFYKFIFYGIQETQADSKKIDQAARAERVEAYEHNHSRKIKVKTISPIQALFTSMATTIGMGNIVGPSMAIAIGGPGALFWLIFYIFIGAATKFTEVVFSVYCRSISNNGEIIGGPSQYLKLISPFLGYWYAILTILLFTIWSSIQVNTISCICGLEGIPPWLSASIAVSLLLFVVLAGVKRIGYFTSKLVPIMCALYVSFACSILLKYFSLIIPSLKLVFTSAFDLKSAGSGLLMIPIFKAMKEGIYKGVFITESGVGTSSIAHALSDVKHPVDQAVLSIFSSLTDIFLCLISGLLTLVTGVWLIPGKLSNTLIYEVFKEYCPIYGGKLVLIVSVFLFVITSLIGNTFNGGQSVAAVTNYKYIKPYFIVAAIIAFSGAILPMPFLWDFMDIILSLIAFPNLIGILILAFKYADKLKFK